MEITENSIENCKILITAIDAIADVSDYVPYWADIPFFRKHYLFFKYHRYLAMGMNPRQLQKVICSDLEEHFKNLHKEQESHI